MKDGVKLYEYKSQRDLLRKCAVRGDIQAILDIICDYTILYDKEKFICKVDTSKLEHFLDEKYIKSINEVFDNLYNLYGFDENITAWSYFKQFLVDGYLAFELIYNEDNTEIIEINSLDPIDLTPDVETNGYNTNNRIWWIYRDTSLQRKFSDSQIIYLSSNDHSINDNAISFLHLFLNVRFMFKEILLKPLWIQLTLKHPELLDNKLFKDNLDVIF